MKLLGNCGLTPSSFSDGVGEELGDDMGEGIGEVAMSLGTGLLVL